MMNRFLNFAFQKRLEYLAELGRNVMRGERADLHLFQREPVDMTEGDLQQVLLLFEEKKKLAEKELEKYGGEEARNRIAHIEQELEYRKHMKK